MQALVEEQNNAIVALRTLLQEKSEQLDSLERELVRQRGVGTFGREAAGAFREVAQLRQQLQDAEGELQQLKREARDAAVGADEQRERLQRYAITEAQLRREATAHLLEVTQLRDELAQWRRGARGAVPSENLARLLEAATEERDGVRDQLALAQTELGLLQRQLQEQRELGVNHRQESLSAFRQSLEELNDRLARQSGRALRAEQERDKAQGVAARLEAQLLASASAEEVGLLEQRLKDYYLKYHRAESFRKALMYQKRYLILLLGGFHQCESLTLSLIARMDRASPERPLERPSALRGQARFRRAGVVVLAALRLRMLCMRWRRALQA
jgi:hypothetical protein